MTIEEINKESDLTEKVLNTLFAYAVSGGDNFRIFFYPDLPASYEINPIVEDLIVKGLEGEKNHSEIVESVIEYERGN